MNKMPVSVHPLLGVFPAFQEDPLQFLLQSQQSSEVTWLRYGIVADVLQRQWQSHGCLLNNPEDIQHVLSSRQRNYHKTGIPPSEQCVFQNGVLHSEGLQHRTRRQLVQSCFHPKNFGQFGTIIVEYTVKRCEGLNHEEIIDISQFMTKLTLTIIGRVLVGKDISHDAPEISQAITVAQQHIALQYRSFTALLLPLWVPTATHRAFDQAVSTLNTWIMKEILTRRKSDPGKPDVLSHLMEAKTEEGVPLTDHEIRDELITLFLAGHETTANALSWLWYRLVQHQEIASNVDHELGEVLQGRLPLASDVPHLPYCKSVFQEVLRLYPPAWLLHLRKAIDSDVLPSGSSIAKGTEMWVSPYATQRNPHVFPNPGHFDPLRFHNSQRERNLQAGFLPFGAGPRRCLGEGFAMMEAILILATIRSLIKFEAISNQQTTPDPLMTLRMKDRFLVKVMTKGMM